MEFYSRHPGYLCDSCAGRMVQIVRCGMKDAKIITVDDCMKSLKELAESFDRQSQYIHGNGSPEAKQLRMYAASVRMALDEMTAKYYTQQ